MKKIFPFLALLISTGLFSQNRNVGIFTAHQDIGSVQIAGGLEKTGDQQYKISGSGQNVWATHDDFHFAWKKMTGDFILDAQLRFIGTGTNAHRKAGWMIRKSLESSSPYADAAVHGDGLTSLQFRRAVDSVTDEIKSTLQAPTAIRFERKGNMYIFSAAKSGQALQEIAKLELNIGDDVYVGLFICSHDDKVKEEAIFSNVRIIDPSAHSVP